MVQVIDRLMGRFLYLLNYENYDEYLNTLIKHEDMWYLETSRVARQVAELGYRNTRVTLDKETFYQLQREVRDFFFPAYHSYVLDSELTTPETNFHHELALRERLNRLGIVSTIIHIHHLTILDHDVSAYIDYAERLKKEDWRPFFQGKKKLKPRRSDLAYYNWRLGNTKLNESSNYYPFIDKQRGLCFRNVHDLILICVDPDAIAPGLDSSRIRFDCPRYGNVVLYDHALRRPPGVIH